MSKGIFTESDQPAFPAHCEKCGQAKYLSRLAQSQEKQIEIRDREIACLRSVLSEWEQDKSCFVQWVEAEIIRAGRETA